MSQAEKKKFLRTLIKLKQQEEFLEKGITTFIMGMKVETDIIEDLIQTRKQCSIERKKVTDTIYRIGSDISDDLATVKLILDHVHEGKKIDPEELKSRLLSLSKKINEFNATTQLETLAAEQKELEDALFNFRINMREYEKPHSGLGAIRHKKNTQSDKLPEDIDYDEIKDFDSLVVKTGHTQHWKQEDHLFFLKVRNKNSNIPAMVLEIRKKCPDLTAEEIVNHESWYKVYVDLREKQKKAVNEWRRKRELEKLERIKSLNNHHKELNYSVIENKNKSMKMKKTDKKIMIKKWKIERESARVADEERIKIQSEGIRSWKEQQFLLRTIEITETLDEYKTKKISEKRNENNDNIVKIPALVKSFRQRDKNYMRKRNNIINAKYENDQDKRAIKTSSARSQRESTLLKPTKIWEERCRLKSTSEETPKKLLYIKNLPRLSTYNWQNQKSIISL